MLLSNTMNLLETLKWLNELKGMFSWFVTDEITDEITATISL
jgi:hypothetical protein